MSVFSEARMQRTNTLCGGYAEFLNVTTGGPHTYH